ncbi:hypothetical protein MKQ68_00375 [Chitinophaga horti]|uniref:DUF2569 domain-containing protein n=1 Tax=Chitinophaga horti TaxID=2920382 RepID=A0ABY6J1P7_9BACT|nr:hypothetical protein [Chitinophaga horti]UYQ93555.1 hypothetical protein MKQ68_00375 [Chitinophaga horti]
MKHIKEYVSFKQRFWFFVQHLAATWLFLTILDQLYYVVSEPQGSVIRDMIYQASAISVFAIIAFTVVYGGLFTLVSLNMQQHQRIHWLLGYMALPCVLLTINIARGARFQSESPFSNDVSMLAGTIAYTIVMTIIYMIKNRRLPSQTDEVINSINVSK